MGANTPIAWCDHTFNPWIGCTKLSPACDHCYAEALARRYGWAAWGPREVRRVTSDTYWRQPLRWNRTPHPGGQRWRVFCASLADVFDKAAPLEARQRLWTLIQATPQLEWRLLTKRPQNIARWLPPDWGQGYANVRFGVTVETQREAARRLPVLARLPMQLKPFASCEPLLEALDLTPYLPLLSQVIIGGESGAKSQARPFELDWARALIAQCREVQVAVFIKQLGRQPLDQGRPLRLRHTKGEDIREWPSALRCQEEPIDAERTDDRSG